MSIAVAVIGASGRLGRVVCDVVEATPEFDLVARLGSADSGDLADDAAIVVDVTTPQSSEAIVDRALQRGQKVLVGTSGWSAEKLAALEKKMQSLPGSAVMVVPNFSVGSVVGTRLAMVAAQFFDSVEIIEAHHRDKIDSPSGTARRTAEQIAEVRRDRGGVVAPHTNQTARGEQVDGIPVHSLRLSGVVAHQDVVFGGVSETLRITHETHSADAYRHGIRLALLALPHQAGLVVGLDAALGFSAE